MARWNSCNVLSVAAEDRHVWQFDAASDSFALNRDQVSRRGEPIPERLAAKTWMSLWQKKLNVAWLPPENVFIRIAHFPASTADETRSMVELQLEKLSPIPLTQAVWSMHILPNSAEGNMQTVAVVIVARSVVEEFLGRLEGEGYLADRLELPFLDQLEASKITGDGAWIYPEAGRESALVAWWYGGILRNVDLITLPPPDTRVAGLKDQLLHMAWAGELEGWLTAPPRWHLVADDPVAAEWVGPLREGLGQLIEVVPPLSAVELAARTARRATQAGGPNLLPPEFAQRYRQQFVDRLWMRGLGFTLGVYVVAVIIYFAALTVLSYKTQAAETQLAGIAPAWTNAVQAKAQFQILKDRQELKFLALDCWDAIAQTLPENVTLNSMAFSADQKRLALSGSAPSAQTLAVSDWSGVLARQPDSSRKPLFNVSSAEPPRIQVAGGGTINWSLELELKRTEAP